MLEIFMTFVLKGLQIQRLSKYRGFTNTLDFKILQKLNFANTEVLQLLRFRLRFCKYSEMTFSKFSSRN